jgi:hypothetical protein
MRNACFAAGVLFAGAVNRKTMSIIDEHTLDALTAQAKASPRLRMNLV